MSNFWKMIIWIFNISTRHRRAKDKWQTRSESYKILKVLLIVVLMLGSVGLFYLTALLINQVGSADVRIIILIYLGIFVCGLSSIIYAVNMYEVLISQVIIAFTCRNPRKTKAPETEVVETENGTAEIIKEETPKSQTSRGFDTFIAILSIILLIAYTAGIFASFILAFN